MKQYFFPCISVTSHKLLSLVRFIVAASLLWVISWTISWTIGYDPLGSRRNCGPEQSLQRCRFAFYFTYTSCRSWWEVSIYINDAYKPSQSGTSNSYSLINLSLRQHSYLGRFCADNQFWSGAQGQQSKPHFATWWFGSELTWAHASRFDCHLTHKLASNTIKD